MTYKEQIQSMDLNEFTEWVIQNCKPEFLNTIENLFCMELCKSKIKECFYTYGECCPYSIVDCIKMWLRSEVDEC